MNYTIKISGNNEKALSIVNMLKVFSNDYDFLQITEEKDDLDFLTSEDRLEFEKRYSYTLLNMKEGKTWEEIEQKLVKK